LENTAAILANL